MSRQLNRFQAAMVIARRDYSATVLSRAFFFFLLGPLFPIGLGLLFGGIGARVASDSAADRVVVVASAQDYRPLAEARERLAGLPGFSSLFTLERAAPGSDPAALLAKESSRIAAVLVDPAGQPRLIGRVTARDPLTGEVRLLLANARDGPDTLPQVAVTTLSNTTGAIEKAREITARAGQALLFLLTLLLSGMLLSQLIEEKSSKVIEVLAAAVQVESIFIGKLLAMLAMSLTGIAVWLTAAIAGLMLLAPQAFAALPQPAVGWPLFLLLGALYFAMSYLLIGAAFLGIGAQAGTAREVQTLSMPVTMAQVGLFALANFAVSDPTGTVGVAAALFPLSSPFAMIARAALDEALLPHLAALLWQLLWVGLILKVAAAWFRRSVLKSGGPARWWRRRAAT